MASLALTGACGPIGGWHQVYEDQLAALDVTRESGSPDALVDLGERAHGGAELWAPAAEGACVMNDRMWDCSEVAAWFWEQWYGGEFGHHGGPEGFDYRVQMVAPTVAVVASVSARARAVKDWPAEPRVAGLMVLRKTDGKWKAVAGQQVSWGSHGHGAEPLISCASSELPSCPRFDLD